MGRLIARTLYTGLLAAFFMPLTAQGDDACAAGAIHSLADVSASDGLTYQVEGIYKSRRRAASKFIRQGGSLHVVEGPHVWVASEDGRELAGDFQYDFALGHQFHAFFLRFEEVVSNIERVDGVLFAGEPSSGLKGVRDTGGVVYLLDGPVPDRPAGLRYDVGDVKIEISADDWRIIDDTAVPFALTIDDGERIFNYRYQWVDLTDKPLTWFYDTVPSPGIDVVDIERLHRTLLIAHCLGDVAMMAGNTAPAAFVASGGAVFETSPEGTATTFKSTFSRRKYSAYVDTALPKVAASDKGDLGWAVVQVNAKGVTPADGRLFDEHWAWVMMARKIDGRWLMAGNASNLRSR